MKKKILVVEDHNLLLLAIRDILEVEGYEVLTASDGVEGLEIMERVRPDLIVADISMPRMNGYEFYKAARSRPEWVSIPFIFLTAKAEREDRLRGKALGVEDYLTKPFDPKELLITVESRIGRAEAIREATEAEFEELKQQIINLLSHELRTPLTSVYGYTELALEEASQLPMGEFHEFLMGIKQGADRLTRLVEDLLLVIRLDTGQIVQEFRVLGEVTGELAASIGKVALAFQKQAEKKGITIETDVPDELPPVRVYLPFFEDALGRLVDNAIKFSRSQGKVVRIRARADDKQIEVAVSDEGVGIAAADIPSLFQRFRQINRAKMEQQGIGIGLVIAQGLIQAMGGEIDVESEAGVGSTFTIRLPVAHEATGLTSCL